MKITRRILQEIIKEEVQNVLLTEGKIDLPGGKFTGLSGYKFHTDPDTWDIDYGGRLEDIEQEVRLFDWVPIGRNNEKIKNRSMGNLFDREIVAADKRNFLDKMKDNKGIRNATRADLEKDPEDITKDSGLEVLFRNGRTSQRDIANHYGKLWAELVMRHAFENTAFFDGALKQVVTFDEMVEYLEDSLRGAQAKNRRVSPDGIEIPYVNWSAIAKGLEYDTEVRKIFDKEIAQRKERLEQQKKTQEKDEEEEQ